MVEVLRMNRCITSGVGTTPLSIDCAQRYAPEIRAELSQLWNVISDLQEDVKPTWVSWKWWRGHKINVCVLVFLLTCPPSCRCAMSYIVPIWWTNFSKSGMMNFFLKALVSNMMLLPTHLQEDTNNIRWRNTWRAALSAQFICLWVKLLCSKNTQ